MWENIYGCINIPDVLHIANINKYTVFNYSILTQFTFYSDKNELNHHSSEDYMKSFHDTLQKYPIKKLIDKKRNSTVDTG